MVTWTRALLTDVKRSDGAKTIPGDRTCDSECGEEGGKDPE